MAKDKATPFGKGRCPYGQRSMQTPSLIFILSDHLCAASEEEHLDLNINLNIAPRKASSPSGSRFYESSSSQGSVPMNDNKHRAKMPGNCPNINLSRQKVMIINDYAKKQNVSI